MIKLALSLILLMPLAASAQTYTEDMQDWRDGYKSSLLTGSHPLKPKDTAFLRFYPIDPDYKANAVFIPVLGAKPFLPENMHGGTQKAVREYGYVYFNLLGASLKLYIYTSSWVQEMPRSRRCGCSFLLPTAPIIKKPSGAADTSMFPLMT